VPIWSWDYRFMTYPAHGWDFDMAKFSGTVSEDGAFRTKRALQTLRGHRVDQTLIRAYFSPAATTGGRYVYSGEFTL
jgi:WD repeat-containing protein 23